MTLATPMPVTLSPLDDPLAVRERPSDHPRTTGFVENVHDAHFRIAAPWSRVWEWLETPETFSEGQVWPYRVDFLASEPGAPVGFHEGGLNIHHGPLLSLPGRLDTIVASGHVTVSCGSTDMTRSSRPSSSTSPASTPRILGRNGAPQW